MEISTPRQLPRSLRPFRKLPPESPRTSEKPLQELLQPQGCAWLEDSLIFDPCMRRKKPPTQTKTINANCLRKLFCLFSACFTGGGQFVQTVSVASPAEPRGEESLFIVQIVGGEKLLEKCRRENFKRRERGKQFYRTRSGSFFGSFFAFFKPSFVSMQTFFGGNFILQTCRPNKLFRNCLRKPVFICVGSSNSVLTLFGLILAPILKLFKLPFLDLGS